MVGSPARIEQCDALSQRVVMLDPAHLASTHRAAPAEGTMQVIMPNNMADVPY